LSLWQNLNWALIFYANLMAQIASKQMRDDIALETAKESLKLEQLYR